MKLIVALLAVLAVGSISATSLVGSLLKGLLKPVTDAVSNVTGTVGSVTDTFSCTPNGLVSQVNDVVKQLVATVGSVVPIVAQLLAAIKVALAEVNDQLKELKTLLNCGDGDGDDDYGNLGSAGTVGSTLSELICVVGAILEDALNNVNV